MQHITESEFIVNDRGAVYHLDLRPEELAPTVITVGDPGRVAVVSKFFDHIEIQREHREFVTHTGSLGGKRISVVSTGIGTDNIDIVLNELDALVNIDFETRTVKPVPTSLNIIRIGTAGGLQADVNVDAFVASTHGIGIDNLLHYYRYDQNEEEKLMLQSFVTHTQLSLAPYLASASVGLLKHFVDGFHQGITVTCPGFYGPQGRVLRLGLAYPGFIDRLTSFSLGNHRICNFEMETSAIYGLGRMLGHHCISLSAIVANRVVKKFTQDGAATVEALIKTTLERIVSI